MIYLDYSATTPVSSEVQDTINKVTKEFIGNANSLNALGIKSKELLESATKQIADLFGVQPNELTYTSSSTESNNMALIGIALNYSKRGKHIIVSKLEHPSIYEICNYLESIGFEISYVDNDGDGLISFDDLKSKLREDTILVSICAVNSETGIRQPLKMLRQIIKKENELTLFHSDLSQAIGKTSINFRDVDLGSVSAHKFYGPKGIGFLYKNDTVKITPIIYGNKNNYYKPGMPALPLIVSMASALKASLKDLDKRERYISLLNDRIVEKLEKMPNLKINKTKYSIPHILNVSFDKVSAEMISAHLSDKEIYINVNKSNEISNAVMAIYNDLERSKRTMRISLSHLTTILEINRFLEVFELEYESLNKFD